MKLFGIHIDLDFSAPELFTSEERAEIADLEDAVAAASTREEKVALLPRAQALADKGIYPSGPAHSGIASHYEKRRK